MAWRSPHPCMHPGCPTLVLKGGYCPEHKPKSRVQSRDFDRRRGSPSARGYDGRWRRIRAAQLEREPCCRSCDGRDLTTVATEVDHIVAKRAGGSDHVSNLQSLCKSCHSRKTLSDIGLVR